MNKINANQFPITFSLVGDKAAHYIANRFDGIIAEINEVIDAGEIIVSHNKDLRSKINNVVEAAFKTYINEPFCYGGKWESLPEEMKHIGYDTPNEARLIPAFERKIARLRKQDHALVIESRKLIEELKPLADVVAFLKSIEVKATVKRAAEKVKKEEELRIKNSTDAVYLAVLPMKELAENRAEVEFRIMASQAGVKISEAGGVLDTLAPIPKKANDYAYNLAIQQRQFYLSICDDDGGILKLSEERIEKEVAKVRRDAAFEFEAYVAKLNAKIGAKVEKAVLEGSPWNGSYLTVYIDGQDTQVWNTKVIVNVSKLGKLFNQWPTRQVS
jgi:hypothetical protein